MPTRPRPAGDIERSGCPYVRTSVHRFVFKVESQDLLIGSKLIFHMRVYLYETSRNTQEP